MPVSCVEEGRWQYDTQGFSSGKNLPHASLCKQVQHCLHDSLARGNGHRTDQVRIWAGIAAKFWRMKVQSHTMAMFDVFAQAGKRLSAYTGHFLTH